MFPLKTEGEKAYLEDNDSYSGNKRTRITFVRAQKIMEWIPYNPDVYGKQTVG